MVHLSPTKTESPRATPNANPSSPVNPSDHPEALRPKRGSPLMDIIQQSSGGALKYICRSFESATDYEGSTRRVDVPGTSTTAAASPRSLIPLPTASPRIGPKKIAEVRRNQDDVGRPLAPFNLPEALGANPLAESRSLPAPMAAQGHAHEDVPGYSNCHSPQRMSSKVVTLQAEPFIAPAARSSVRYTLNESTETCKIKVQGTSPLEQLKSPTLQGTTPLEQFKSSTPQATSPSTQFASPTLQSTKFPITRPLSRFRSETPRMRYELPSETVIKPAVTPSSKLVITELRDRRINFVENATTRCKGDLWETFLESFHSDVSNFEPPPSKEGARHIFPPPPMWEGWERDLLSHMDLSAMPVDKRGLFGVVPCVQREALRFLYGCGLRVATAQQAMEAQILWRNHNLPYRWSGLKRLISTGAVYVSGVDRLLRPILVLRLIRLRAVKVRLTAQPVTEMYFCFWLDVCRAFLLHDEKIGQINVVIDAAGVDYPFVQFIVRSLVNVCGLYPMLFSKVHVVNWRDLPVPRNLTQEALQMALCEMGLEGVCVFDELQNLPVSALETDLGGSRPVMQNFKSLRRLMAPLLVSSRSWSEKNSAASWVCLGSMDHSVYGDMSFRTVPDSYRPSESLTESRSCREDFQGRQSRRSHRSVSNQSRRSLLSCRSSSQIRSRSASQSRRSRWSGSIHQDNRGCPLIPPVMASWKPPVTAICSHSGRHIFSLPEAWSPEERQAVQDLAFALPENLPPTVYDDEAHMLRVLYGCDFDTTIAVQDIEEAVQHSRRRLAVTEDQDMKVKATCGAVYFHGRDKRLRPVLVVNAARLKEAAITVNDLCHIFDYWILFAIDYLFVPTKVEQLVCVVDMSGSGVFDIPILKLPRLLTHLRRLYHSRLRKVIVVNHTRVVRSLWSPLSGSLTAMELARVSVVKESPEEVLLSHIPADQLERRLGGTAKNLKAGFRMPPFTFVA